METTLRGKITVIIAAMPAPSMIKANITVVVDPAETTSQIEKIVYPFTVNTDPIGINLSIPIIELANEFVSSSLSTYVDEDRQLKTLLNFGDDKQSVVLNYRYGPLDENLIPRIQLKLLQPLQESVALNDTVFLSREVVKTLIDKVRVRFAPELDTTPYLRPKNTSVKTDTSSGKALKNVTLKLLSLQSGSVGASDTLNNVSFEDSIFRQWYSYDFNSSELNMDFTDYNQFVFYGSAAMRLEAFKEKLIQLERLDIERVQFVNSLYTGSVEYAGMSYIQEQSAQLSKDKENIIRSFDRYEQYLYFTPSSSMAPYTASAYYADDAQEFNSTAYWPKISSSSLYSVTSSIAEDWYSNQYAIAQRYDEFNENNLINTIPTHVRDDDNSASYLTFTSMIGHFFDTLKPYIDQFSYINSRGLNPNTELSKDLVSEIAESVGFQLPTLNSIYNLSDNILGTETQAPRRDFTVETYKRLLHNLPFFAKAKGTKTSLETLLRSFGISPQLISVRESGAPTTSSFSVFDEFTTGVDFDEGTPQTITIPIAAANRIPSPTSLQLNMTVAKNKSMTVMNGDTKWALHAKIHPTNTNLGRFELTSGSSQTVILSSSYQEIFGDALLNVSIRNYSTYANLTVIQTDGDATVFNSSHTETVGANTFVPLWTATNNVYIGGSGSLVSGRYDGTIDEVRLWGINLSDEMIENTAFDPASNAGDTYQDPRDSLYVQLAFSNVDTSLLPTYLTNESPYSGINGSPSLSIIETSGLAQSDFIRYNRLVRQPVLTSGPTSYLTNKIKVLPEPVFQQQSINSQGVKQLSRTRSIVVPETKRIQAGRNKVIISTSPTEIINQNIVRTLGLENINAVLGAPSSLYTTFAASLDQLKRYYSQYYYVEVNFNRYIRILSEVNSVLDQVLDYFIPSKATLLNGIVIEPNILEQVKISPIRDVRVYGGSSRRTQDAPGSLTGSRPDYAATFTLSKNIVVSNQTSTTGSYATFTSQLDPIELALVTGSYYGARGTVDEYLPIRLVSSASKHQGTISVLTTFSGSYPSYVTTLPVPRLPELVASASNLFDIVESANPTLINSKVPTYTFQHVGALEYADQIVSPPSRIDLGMSLGNKIKFNATNKGSTGAEPYNRLYTRKLFDYEIEQTRPGGVTSTYIPALYEIFPAADFRDVGVTTYFNQPFGIYYYPQITKTPSYNNPINFEAATTWSFGGKYNIYDVVYQYVDNSYSPLGHVTGSARAGNKKFYVFTTRPAYVSASFSGSAFYSGSVPTYTPPSLDRVNWKLLRFTPSQVQVPKRIVFDTFTVSSPVLNNFKLTTISTDTVVDVPERYIDSLKIPLIQSASYVTGDVLVQNIATLFAIQSTSANIRVRLYSTAANRDADISRNNITLPTGAHGVLLDMVVSAADTAILTNAIPSLVSGDVPAVGKIYYTFNNVGLTDLTSITMILYYFAIQVEPRVPSGYLRKHYRFFRDTSTGTKRRNYEGCKNTIDTTIDGLPPVQVFVGEGTELVVSPTTSGGEIITGGGGQLSVT